MQDGDTIKVAGSGKADYEVRYRGGIHYCTCSTWRFQHLPVTHHISDKDT
jgi:hypothetical protein